MRSSGPSGPAERPPTVLAALGPKMLRLAAEQADGAHPYFVPVEHTAQAREILGPDPILAPEQMVVIDTDRTRALETARKAMAVYLRAPNYVNNLKRLRLHRRRLGRRRQRAPGRRHRGRAATSTPRSGRIKAHLDAGADHVCAQLLTHDAPALPEAAWRELAAAVGELQKG